MKINDPIGIIIQHEAISPEVVRAQRLAELKDIAEYRARHLKAIQDWSDPVKRKKIQDEHAAAERAAREEMAGKDIDPYRVRTVKNQTFIAPLTFKVTPIVKPLLKRPWWRRLLDWFR